MISKLRSILLGLLVLAAAFVKGQAPNISYGGSKVYPAGFAIPELAPINTGGAVPVPKPVKFAPYNDGNGVGGATVDAEGNVYVPADGGERIGEISPGGKYNNFLSFDVDEVVSGIAVDVSGSIFAADAIHGEIYELPSNYGAPRLVASGFEEPLGIAVDNKGFIYVADLNGNQITKIPLAGGKSLLIGNGLFVPTGVAVDTSGNVFVSCANGFIQEIRASDGATFTIANVGGNAWGIALDAGGDIFVITNGNVSYLAEIPAGESKPIAVGSGFIAPRAVAVDTHGNVFVPDPDLQAVMEISKGGYTIAPALPEGLTFNPYTGVIGGTPQKVIAATDYTVTATNASGSTSTTVNLTVNLPDKPRISYSSPQVYTFGTAITPLAPTNSGGAISPPVNLTSGPNFHGITTDSAGNVYVAADTILEKISSVDGHLTIVNAQINVGRIAADKSGNLYITDSEDATIKKIPAGGSTAVTLVSGLYNLEDIALDGKGDIYVTQFVGGTEKNDVIEIPAGTQNHCRNRNRIKFS